MDSTVAFEDSPATISMVQRNPNPRNIFTYIRNLGKQCDFLVNHKAIKFFKKSINRLYAKFMPYILFSEITPFFMSHQSEFALLMVKLA